MYTQVETRKTPAITKTVFLKKCASIWMQYEDLTRIVAEIEFQMQRYGVQYLRKNIQATIAGSRGIQVLTAQDEFTKDLFNNANNESDVIRICDKHFNYLHSTLTY